LTGLFAGMVGPSYVFSKGSVACENFDLR